MNVDILGRLLLMAILCLVQAVVLNHIHLFGCATPLLYVYMVLVFPHNMGKWAMLLWAFALGLSVDIFSNTPGVASASLTALAALQPYFFNLFVQSDMPEDVKPSAAAIGFGKYSFYVFAMVLIYCLMFYSLETFHFFNLHYWLVRVAGSTLLTAIIILTFESFRKK